MSLGKCTRLGAGTDNRSTGGDRGQGDSTEQSDKEPTFDKYRVIKRQTSYATPEHYEKVKKYLYEEDATWGQHQYPSLSDDIDEDKPEMIVPTEHQVCHIATNLVYLE